MLALTACGEETQGSTGPDGSVDEQDAQEEASGEQFMLRGIVAKGEPLSDATVDVVCPEGVTGQATADADGAYEVSLAGQAVSCALRVTSGTDVFYSFSLAGDSTAHISPLTDMTFQRMIQLSDLEVDSWFAAPSDWSLVESSFGDAIGKLQSDLASAGYTLPPEFNPHSAPTFVAMPGDPLDDLLEQIALAISLDPDTADYAAFLALFLANQPLPSPPMG